MTNQDTFAAAKTEIIGKINSLPNEIEVFDMDRGDIMVDVAAAKKTLVSKIENQAQFTPAFSPERNVFYGMGLEEEEEAILFELDLIN